jgi:NAD(P)-dependent dehydrogenase (short-subunit alcohol dehydrogenase family)
LDVRFAVNTLAPYLLTKLLLPLFGREGRVINLSSAAQSSVDLASLRGERRSMNADLAYAQSKLALTMWSRALGFALKESGPAIIAVNPASMLGSKMVREAYGIKGGDLNIGADILCRAALHEEFSDVSGLYFDNDRGIFASPHPDALDDGMNKELVDTKETILKRIFQRSKK